MEINKNSAEDLQVQIGKNIEKKRMAKEMSASDMAAALGLTLAAYRNIERGITEVSFLKIVRIAEVLNIHYAEILELEGAHVYQNNHNRDAANNTGVSYHSAIYNQLESGYKIAIKELKEQINNLRQQNRELMIIIKKPK